VACDAVDADSLQPELKHAAVQIARLKLPYPLAVIRRCESQAEALELMQDARSLLDDYPYANISLYGRQAPLVVFRAALGQAPAAAAIAEIDGRFGLDGEVGAIIYADPARQISKKAIARAGRLFAVRLAGETLAQTWLKQAMAEDELDAGMIRFALAPSGRPPVSIAPRNIVCKCADISDAQIRVGVAESADLPTLQQNLKCGTFCGSCVPDIKRMLVESKVKETAPV
jgi:assimilatory nitrate reductase catalytic subunit